MGIYEQFRHMKKPSKRSTTVAINLLIIIVFAVTGSVLLLQSHAATSTPSLEAESGNASSAISRVTDATASNGSALKFGPGTVSSGDSCTPDTRVTTGFPNNCTTGVPAGITLTAYSGPLTISSCGTVIDSKLINGDINLTASNGTTSASTPCLTIKNSKIIGDITTDANSTNAGGPTVLTDDEFDGGTSDEDSVIFGSNMYLTRLNVHGGKANFQCSGKNCSITDSFLHDMYFAAFHFDAVGSNGVNNMDVEHNSLICNFTNTQAVDDSGGCSADIGFFGDFGLIQNVTVNNNLFMASADPGYCVITNASKPGKAYPTGQNLVWTNNTFQRGSNNKCGYYGAVDEWQSGSGNVWSGNKWDDGSALNE